MPSNYTADPTATQPPSPAPSLADGVLPILSTPSDGDNLNASSVLQSFKTLADWTGFLKQTIAPYRGTRLWNSTTQYVAGMTVVDPFNSRAYRAKDTNTNFAPHSYSGYWDQCDYGNSEIQAISGQIGQDTGGITCSNGASVAGQVMLGFGNGGMKLIFLVVQNVPLNGLSQVDLTDNSVKFDSFCRGAVCSLMSGGHSYGGEVGYNPVTDPNVFAVWAKKGTGDPGSLCSIGLILWGA